MQPMLKLTAVLALAGACAAPAGAASYNLFTFLDGAQSGTLSPATGAGTLTYDDVSNLLTWNIGFTVDSLLAAETVSHFHGPAAAGVNAGVQIGLPTGSPKIGNATLSEAQEADLLGELWYINVHTGLHPGGEIRGQILLVPEPATYALMLAGLGLVGWVAARRRGA